jgi:hypothetical protein
MLILTRTRNCLLTVFLVIATQVLAVSQPIAQTQPVSILIARHAEYDASQPTQPLTPAGRRRAELFAQTLRGIKFTHVFASFTTRARQMVEAIASARGLTVMQLPVPGSTVDGQPVTDQTDRRAAIEPISTALLKLAPGSVALAALNSENIFAILNRLGVSVAPQGKSCTPGSMCVPCTDNSCYPRSEYDLLWHLVREPGRAEPLAFIELRYAAGGRVSDQ